MAGWVLPALGYLFLLGALGVTLKLALKDVAGILIFVALDRGPASQVVPVTAAYPVITLIGSALFLSERITVVRGIGTALVVVGVALLSR
jgi:transporter family protein